MQIGEQHMLRREHGPLDRLRLFDFDDHVGRGEHGVGIGEDACPDRLIVAVLSADAEPGPTLHDDVVAVVGQLIRTCRGEPDPSFVGLDLGRNTNNHRATSPVVYGSMIGDYGKGTIDVVQSSPRNSCSTHETCTGT